MYNVTYATKFWRLVMQVQESMMNDLFTELSEQEQEVVTGGLDYTAFFNNLATQYGVTGPTGYGGSSSGGSGSFNFSSLASYFGGSSSSSSSSSFNFSSLASMFGGSSSGSSYTTGTQAGPSAFF
jgi:hypothetical protein